MKLLCSGGLVALGFGLARTDWLFGALACAALGGVALACALAPLFVEAGRRDGTVEPK